MDVRSSQGTVAGEGAAAAESPRRHSSVCSLRSNSLLEDHQDCRSLSHLGILVPFYLTPLLFLTDKYGRCLYCLLLPLLLWAFNSLPKPGAALVHLVSVPALGLIAPEDIARQYLCADVLSVALVLFLVIVVDRWSELVLSLANGVCARFGLQRKRLFVGTCLCSFVIAWLFSGVLVPVTVLYFLDRVLSTIRKENMDLTPDSAARSPRRGSAQESSSVRSLIADDKVLFDRLAQLAVLMKKPERRKCRPRALHAEGKVDGTNAAAATTVSGTHAVPEDQTQALQSSLPITVVTAQPADLDWGTGAIAEPPFEALDTEAYGRGVTGLAVTGLARVDIADKEGTLNSAQPLSSQNELAKKKQSEQPQNEREPRAPLSLRPLPVTSFEGTGDKHVTSQASAVTTADRRSKHNRQRTLSSMFWRNSSGHKNRVAKDADETSPLSPSKPRHRLFRSLSLFPSRLVRKRPRDAKFQQADVESARRHNANGAPTVQLHSGSEGPRSKLAEEKMAPLSTAAGGSFQSYSQPRTARVPGQPASSAQDDSAPSNVAPAQRELALSPNTQASGTATGSAIHPASVPVESGAHLGPEMAPLSVVTVSGSSVSVALAQVTSVPGASTKPAGEVNKTCHSGVTTETNLPCETSRSAQFSSEKPTARLADNMSRQQTAEPAEEETGGHHRQGTDNVAPVPARVVAHTLYNIESQGANEDDKFGSNKTHQTEDSSAAGKNEEHPENIIRDSLNDPYDFLLLPKFESKEKAEEHLQQLEPIGKNERQCSTGSAANPSRNIGQQEDKKAFERIRCDSCRPGSCGAERKPEPCVPRAEDPGTEKWPRKKSKDSLCHPLPHNYPRRTSTSVREPTGGSQDVLGEKEEKWSRESSATEISANKERSPALKTSSSVPAQKKQQTHKVSSRSQVDPIKPKHKSGGRRSEERHRNHPEYDPDQKKEKQPRRRSKDSLDKQPHHHTQRPKSKASTGEQVEVLQAVSTAKQARHPHRKLSSKTDSDVAIVVGVAKQVSARDAEDPQSALQHELLVGDLQTLHSLVSTTGTPGALAADSNHMHHHKDKTRSRAESGAHKTGVAFKTHPSLPDKPVCDKHPSAQLESDKPLTTATPKAQSRRGSTRERTNGSDTDAQSNSSRRSKPPVKSRHGCDVHEVKDHAAGLANALATEDGKQKHACKLPGEFPSKSTAAKKTQQTAESQPAPDGATVRNCVRAPEKLLRSTGPTISEETRRCQNFKSVPAVVPSGREPQQATSSAAAPNARNEADAFSAAELKRKHSIVSFGADHMRAIQPQPVPFLPRATLQADVSAALPSQPRRLSTILKASSLTTTAPRPRRRSSVDFGSAKFTIISPLQMPGGAPPARRHSACSRVSSTGSLSSLGGGSEGRGPISLRRTTRSRSCGFEDTTSRPSLAASQVGNQGPSFLKKKTNRRLIFRKLRSQCWPCPCCLTKFCCNRRSARADVHNAFLLGSALMTVLGNICCFHSNGYRAAMGAVSPTAGTENQFVTGFTWVIVTLPGALMASFACTVIIWLVYIRPHEPEPLSPENLVVMTNARERAGSPVKRRGVECAYAAYFVILSLSYAPSLVLGLEPRMTLVVALTSMILVTSSLTSCLRAAFEFIRNIWQMLPWGVLLLLGATHVASELVQVNKLLIEAFDTVPLSFWEERTLLEVQTMLAFAASIMAEATDKQVLIEILMPVVVRISEIKQMHPVYYTIPVLAGASSNVIMPSSVPTALLHDLSRVPFWKLLLLGLFAKIVVMSMVIVTVNIMDRVGLLATDATHD